MKITVPSDYHAPFSKAITIALLVEHGKFSAAFAEVGHSEAAYEESKKWGKGVALTDRDAILMRCERRLGVVGYVPDEGVIASLKGLQSQIEALPASNTLTVDDKGAKLLSDALEFYSRLGIGQVDGVLDSFCFKSSRPDLAEDVREMINDMRHLAIVQGGASFGITNNFVQDEVRNAWFARKFIEQHMAYKRHPEGRSTLSFDTPMRLGSCTNQDIVINDPEFVIPSKDVREKTRHQPVPGQGF